MFHGHEYTVFLTRNISSTIGNYAGKSRNYLSKGLRECGIIDSNYCTANRAKSEIQRSAETIHHGHSDYTSVKCTELYVRLARTAGFGLGVGG